MRNIWIKIKKIKKFIVKNKNKANSIEQIKKEKNVNFLKHIKE